MNPLIKLFEAFVFAFATVAIIVCIRQAVRAGRVTPVLWLLLGLLGCPGSRRPTTG